MNNTMTAPQVIEYKNNRILTTQQIAEAYETSTDYITKNFNRNKERYVEGKHYFKLEGEILSEFAKVNLSGANISKIRALYLWTERGAFLHAKSLNTDKAWEVYDELVEHYFRSTEAKPASLPSNYKEALLQLVAQIEENERLGIENKSMKPKAEYFDQLVERNLLTNLRDTSKEFGINQKKFIETMIKSGYLYRDSKKRIKPYQKYVEDGMFELKEFHNLRNGHADVQTLITPKGRETIRLLLPSIIGKEAE